MQEEASKGHPVYRKFQENPGTEAAPIFGISCDEGRCELIVCTGMSEYVADWLLPILQGRPFAIRMRAYGP